MRGPRLPRYGGALPAITASVASRCLLHWRPDWAGQSAQTGAVLCVTDHQLTFTRGGNTLASVATSSGGTYTAAAGQVAWESRTLYTGSKRMGVRSGATDTLTSPQVPTPQAMALLAEFICDTDPAVGYNLLTIGTTTTTDPALILFVLPTSYRLLYTSTGSSYAYCDVARTSADNGKLIRLRGTWTAGGACELYASVDGAAEGALGTQTGTLARVAWAAGTQWRIGSGRGANVGLSGWHGGVKVIAGEPAEADVLGVW